jgi:acyl-CoA thioester hydrolase
MADASFKLRHRIMTRFGESDMQGVIFNARYLDYADLAMSVYWPRAGLQLFGNDQLEFLVANANIDFKASLRPYEFIELCCRTERVGNSSLTTLIEIHGEKGEPDLRAVIRIVHVCIDHQTRRPVPLPSHVKDCLAAFDGRAEPLLTGERA